MEVKRRRWGLFITDEARRQAKVMSSEEMETIGEYIEGLLKAAWDARGKVEEGLEGLDEITSSGE